MIFPRRPRAGWRLWFAWRPVRLVDLRWVWLSLIERRPSSSMARWYYRERGTWGGE